MNKKIVVYINIPFCIKDSPYIQGTHVIADSASKSKYLSVVSKEIESYRDDFKEYEVAAVRIGGGSPSIVNPDELGSMMRTVRDCFAVAPKAEFTIEAIPNTIGTPSLTGWGQGRPNRVELNIGSLQNNELKTLNAPFTASDVQNATALLRRFKMENYAMSFLVGIPGQTEQSLKATIKEALRYSPVEIVIRPAKSKAAQCLPTEKEKELYRTAAGILDNAGYHEYINGRFAPKETECTFYRELFSGTNLIGIGLDAISLQNGLMARNIGTFEEYCSSEGQIDKLIAKAAEFDKSAQNIIALTGAVKFADGVSIDQFDCEAANALMDSWVSNGLAEKEDGTIKLTFDGRFASLWKADEELAPI